MKWGVLRRIIERETNIEAGVGASYAEVIALRRKAYNATKG